MNVATDTESMQAENSGHEWLCFRLAGLEYGVDILRVKEIRAWQAATRVPHSPDYLVGLINLRGAIVPIVDMRKRIGIETKNYDKETVILILEVQHEDEQKIVGIVVDAIAQVIRTHNENSQLAPNFNLAIAREYVHGIADEQDQMVVLLNIDTLLHLQL